MFCLNLNCLPKKLTDRNIITTTCRVIGRESELLDLYNGSMNDLTPRGRYKRVEGGVEVVNGCHPSLRFFGCFSLKIKHQQLTLTMYD